MHTISPSVIPEEIKTQTLYFVFTDATPMAYSGFGSAIFRQR